MNSVQHTAAVTGIPFGISHLQTLASHSDSLLVARVVLATNQLFRPAMRMLVVHPVNGQPAPVPTPPRVAQMWTELAKLRAMLEQRLSDSSNTDLLRRCIVKFLCTIVVAFTERSDESKLRVDSAGSRAAAVVVNGPDSFCVSDVPPQHPSLPRRELDNIAKTLVSTMSGLLLGSAIASWGDSAVCNLIAHLSWVATVRPPVLPVIAQTIASMVQSPCESLRPTVSESRDSLSRRLRPAVALAVRTALVRLMKRKSAAGFTSDLGACLFVMGDEQRPAPLAQAARSRIDFKVVEQLRAMAPQPRPDASQTQQAAFSIDSVLDAYSAVDVSTLYDLGDEYAPPPSEGSAAVGSKPTATIKTQNSTAHDPRLSSSELVGGDPRSGYRQRNAASEQHSVFKLAPTKPSSAELEKMGNFAFERFSKSTAAALWRSAAVHSLEGLATIHQWICWAVDPDAHIRRRDALAVIGSPKAEEQVDTSDASERRAERCSLIMSCVCEDYVERADIGARLLSALWMACDHSSCNELLLKLTETFIRAAVMESTTSVKSPTLVVDVACALPYDCLSAVLAVVQELLASQEAALMGSGFRIMDAYRSRRPQHEARLLQFYLCVAHTAESEGAQATAIKAVEGSKTHLPYVTQFATTVALSLARPPGANGVDADGWMDQTDLLFPYCKTDQLTDLEQAAVQRFAGGVIDVHDARRRVGLFFRLCARCHSLLQLVPWLYCNAAGDGGAATQQNLLAQAVRTAITATPLWLNTLKILKKKLPTHEVLKKLGFESGVQSDDGGSIGIGAGHSVQLPHAGILTQDIQQASAFVPLVAHVLEVCTDGAFTEGTKAQVGQWGISISSPMHAAALPVETIQAALSIGSKIGGEEPMLAELRILLPLLKFLPAPDILALVPHYMCHVRELDLTCANLLNQYLMPGSSSCSVDAAVLLAWILLGCSADIPCEVCVFQQTTGDADPGRPSLATASLAAQSSIFFARYSSSTTLGLELATSEVQGLLTSRQLFDASMIWAGLGLLAALQPPPKLLMFWFLSAREAFSTEVMSRQLCALLGQLVDRANLHKDTTAAVWEDENTWKGFRKFVLTTIPASLPVILKLPLDVLQKLVGTNPKLKMRLEAFVESPMNQTGVNEGILTFLGVTHSGKSALVDAEHLSHDPDANASRVGGRKRGPSSLHDSRSSLRPRSG